MSDLFRNHIVGFRMRQLKFIPSKDYISLRLSDVFKTEKKSYFVSTCIADQASSKVLLKAQEFCLDVII